MDGGSVRFLCHNIFNEQKLITDSEDVHNGNKDKDAKAIILVFY